MHSQPRYETEVSIQLSSLTLLNFVRGGPKEGPPRTALEVGAEEKSHALVGNRSPGTLCTVLYRLYQLIDS